MADSKKKIKLNDEQLMLSASNIADIYHQLSNDLFDQVIERVLERGTYYLEQQPYLWQLEKMQQMGLLNDANVALIAERSGIAEKQLRYIIENEGYKVYKDTKAQLAEALGQGTIYNNSVMEDLLSYSNQAMFDINNLINTTLPKSVQDVYKSVIEESVARTVTGISTSEKAIADTLMKWHAKGFYGFTDSQGKNWKADTYARMVIKSTAMRVRNEIREAPARELGIDTYYYSMKSAAREMCAPLQHQIVTTGVARIEAGERILALSDYGYGTAGGCLGVNCMHIKTPFIPGVNIKPDLPDDLKDLTPEQATENANAQAKQRALERNIRFSKEQLHVAKKIGDQELIDKYRGKLGNQKQALKDFLDEHPFLHRDREREKHHEDPKSWATNEIKQREFVDRREKFRAQQKEMKELFTSYSESGIIKLEVNNESYENHVQGTKGYQKYVENNKKNGKPNPSYLTISKEEVQELINRYAGTGQFRYSPKIQRIQEIISQDKVIGTYIDQKTGEIIENVTEFRIHYSKTGAHIVPTIKGKGRRK